MTFWAVGAAIAGPVIGGMMGSDSADSGYQAQAGAAAASDATQRYMYDTNRADNKDFLRNGTNASNRLAYLMGLGGGGSGGAGGNLTAEQIRAQLLPSFTTAGSNGAPKEGDPGYVPGDYVMRNGQWGTWTTNGDQSPYWYSPGGSTATGSTIDETGLQAAINARLSSQPQIDTSSPDYGSLTRKFNQSDLAGDVVYNNGLQFGLDEGRKGLERQAQASGGLLSGATLKALSRYGNDYATTKTEGAYNRYTQDNTNTYNKLAGIAGSGQTASAQVGSAGQNYANNVSQTAQGLGNARAASGIASANAMSGGLQGAFNNYQGGQLLKQIQRPSTSSYSYNTGSEPYAGYNASVGL